MRNPLLILAVIFIFSVASAMAFTCDSGTINDSCIVSSSKTIEVGEQIIGSGNITITSSGRLYPTNNDMGFLIDLDGDFVMQSGADARLYPDGTDNQHGSQVNIQVNEFKIESGAMFRTGGAICTNSYYSGGLGGTINITANKVNISGLLETRGGVSTSCWCNGRNAGDLRIIADDIYLSENGIINSSGGWGGTCENGGRGSGGYVDIQGDNIILEGVIDVNMGSEGGYGSTYPSYYNYDGWIDIFYNNSLDKSSLQNSPSKNIDSFYGMVCGQEGFCACGDEDTLCIVKKGFVNNESVEYSGDGDLILTSKAYFSNQYTKDLIFNFSDIYFRQGSYINYAGYLPSPEAVFATDGGNINIYGDNIKVESQYISVVGGYCRQFGVHGDSGNIIIESINDLNLTTWLKASGTESFVPQLCSGGDGGNVYLKANNFNHLRPTITYNSQYQTGTIYYDYFGSIMTFGGTSPDTCEGARLAGDGGNITIITNNLYSNYVMDSTEGKTCDYLYNGSIVFGYSSINVTDATIIPFYSNYCENWVCDVYDSCQPDITGGVLNCIVVSGEPIENCGNEDYIGDYFEFTEFCDYCIPEYSTLYGVCINGNRTVSQSLDNNETCCMVTGNSTDCYVSGELIEECELPFVSPSYRDYQVEAILTETGTGIGVVMDRMRLPVGQFILFLAIIGGVVALILGIVFAIKQSLNKNM